MVKICSEWYTLSCFLLQSSNLGLNEHHYEVVVNYLRFARYKRSHNLRGVEGCFQDVKDSRWVLRLYLVNCIGNDNTGELSWLSGLVKSAAVRWGICVISDGKDSKHMKVYRYSFQQFREKIYLLHSSLTFLKQQLHSHLHASSVGKLWYKYCIAIPVLLCTVKTANTWDDWVKITHFFVIFLSVLPGKRAFCWIEFANLY